MRRRRRAHRRRRRRRGRQSSELNQANGNALDYLGGHTRRILRMVAELLETKYREADIEYNDLMGLPIYMNGVDHLTGELNLKIWLAPNSRASGIDDLLQLQVDVHREGQRVERKELDVSGWRGAVDTARDISDWVDDVLQIV